MTESLDSLYKRRYEVGEEKAAERRETDIQQREKVDMKMRCVSEGWSQMCKTEQSMTSDDSTGANEGGSRVYARDNVPSIDLTCMSHIIHKKVF